MVTELDLLWPYANRGREGQQMVEENLDDAISRIGPAAEGERRRAPRVAYEAVVLVAPYDGINFPASTAFVTVNTRDLSATGISFITTSPPGSRSIVLVFRQRDKDPIVVVARVVHFLEFTPEPDRTFLMGCEMHKRLPVSRTIMKQISAADGFSLLV